jgi:hypothetical protein
MVQTPDLIVVVYEAFTLWRQIFMDGRRLDRDPNPTWMGYSTGRWEGNTLVVDSRGFNGKLWLDQLGKPTTEKLHVIERFRRTDYGHMTIEATIDDLGAYTKPWTVTTSYHLLPDTELLEFICNENNRDLEHLPGGSPRKRGSVRGSGTGDDPGSSDSTRRLTGRRPIMRKSNIALRLGLLGGLAFTAAVAFAQPAAQPLVVKMLKKNVYVAEGGGGNTGIIVGDKGVIVIDAKTTPASGIRSSTRSRSSPPSRSRP